MRTSLNSTYEDLFQALAKLTPEQRACNLAVELHLEDLVLSSAGGSIERPDVVFDIAGINHDTLDEDHPVIVVQY